MVNCSMKVVLLSLSLLLAWTGLLAQKEATIWYYGRRAGLNFSTFPPTPLFDGALNSSEAAAVMADKRTGQLLFYSDGTKVWNRAHRLMPNGDGLLAAPTTSTQGALIVPAPGNESLFYLFTVATPAYANLTTPGLFYSLVDMQADVGQGDVILSSKNTPLLTDVSEKLTAIPHANGRDYWVITHGWNNNLFYVYRLTAQGVSTPQTYPSGTVHKDTTELTSESAGYLKASPDGRRLACAVLRNGRPRPFELYDFDASTGQISHYQNLGNFQGQYGVSFSPDSRKLYLTLNGRIGQTFPDSTLCQFDLARIQSDGRVPYQYLRYQAVRGLNPYAGGDSADVETTIPLRWALQLGPDGKLYCSSPYVINRPNAIGDSCLITSLEPLLNGQTNRGFTLGLPNFIQAWFNNLLPRDNIPSSNCDLEQTLLFYPNPTANLLTIGLKEGCQAAFTYRVYNTTGQLLQNNLSSNVGYTAVDLSVYAAGFYFIEVRIGQQRRVLKVLKV